MKNTPMGRAPQVKREHVEDVLIAEDVGTARTNKRSTLGQLDVGQFSGSSAPTSPAESLSSPDQQQQRHATSQQFPAGGGAPTVDIKFRPPRKAPVGGKWTEDEDQRLREIVEMYGAKNWKRLASILGNVRSDVQCLHRWNKVLRPGLSKGPWTTEEDKIVKDMVLKHGAGNIKWSVIAAQLPGRIGKQCRERWFNHLDPEIKKGDWTPEEDSILFETQRIHGNRWSEIAKLLPGRTENAVKNRWNSSARKRWLRENGLSESPCSAQIVRSPATMPFQNPVSPAPVPSLPQHLRPPVLTLLNHNCSANLMNNPITDLLDQDQHGLLGASGILGVADSVDLLSAFHDEDKTENVDPGGTDEAQQLIDARVTELRASDEMDFSKAVDYLSMDPFGADGSSSMNVQFKPEDLRHASRHDEFPSYDASVAFDNSSQGKTVSGLEGTTAALSMMPPSMESGGLSSSFDSGLRAALNGVMPPPTSGVVGPPTAFPNQTQPEMVKLESHDGFVPEPKVDGTGPLSEQLQRAATVAVERIVAASSEKEVPLTMLPYFHFLNLMAQFSETTISSPHKGDPQSTGQAHHPPIDTQHQLIALAHKVKQEKLV
ncbi:hypothetical protein CTAYLR_005722 [Chrysophaeum taylorii]|uniref:Uncharacterized protein n=1 Tax=Chrysophaeum taylorii TaxID=2483200 RepID=A0AAD7XN55_9STRA|nr:hypothetical protein CTAYLR_005722 [Chrysophaeum taylorii]